MASVLDIRIGELAAWHYATEGASACVVMGHGFSAVRDQRLPAYAERFAQAGLAALLFDYRGFGSSGGEPRLLLDIGRQLEDWRTALGWARAHYEGVGLFGASFGGGHVIEIARTERDVRAVVAQCPLTDGLRAVLKIPPVTALKLTKIGIQDALGAKLGRKPRLVPAVGRPGELAVMTAPDALPGFEAMTEPGMPWVNRVSARIGLQVLRYRPGSHADEVTCPLLLCVCEKDSVVSAEAAYRVADAAPQGELVRYPIGHFDIYQGEWFERAVTRQAEFLARHLA
jgi:pimeloyl-ACP methyl ester carboxylesterase